MLGISQSRVFVGFSWPLLWPPLIVSARCRRSVSASCWLVLYQIRVFGGENDTIVHVGKPQCAMHGFLWTRFESFHRNQFPLILFDAVVMVNQWLVLRHQQVTCRYGQPGAIAPKLFATVKGFSGG